MKGIFKPLSRNSFTFTPMWARCSWSPKRHGARNCKFSGHTSHRPLMRFLFPAHAGGNWTRKSQNKLTQITAHPTDSGISLPNYG
jgi:hypothetical protein